MIRITPFETDHAYKIELREQDMWLKEWIPSQAVMHKEFGIGFTVWHEDTILMCIGADLLWKGVGEMWALISVHYAGMRFTMQKVVLSIIDSFLCVHSLHRLQTPIPIRNKQSTRYAESMGFHREGTLEKFDSQKEDYTMYARVR